MTGAAGGDTKEKRLRFAYTQKSTGRSITNLCIVLSWQIKGAATFQLPRAAALLTDPSGDLVSISKCVSVCVCIFFFFSPSYRFIRAWKNLALPPPREKSINSTRGGWKKSAAENYCPFASFTSRNCFNKLFRGLGGGGSIWSVEFFIG